MILVTKFNICRHTVSKRIYFNFLSCWHKIRRKWWDYCLEVIHEVILHLESFSLLILVLFQSYWCIRNLTNILLYNLHLTLLLTFFFLRIIFYISINGLTIKVLIGHNRYNFGNTFRQVISWSFITFSIVILV